MNIDRMQYFITAIDCGSLSAAASELFLTLQGLNQALQRLESEYGVKLYYRDGNRVLPTEAGTILYHTFSEIIALNSQAINQLKSNSYDEMTLRKNSVTILSAPIFTEMILPRLLPIFYKKNPYARLRIIEFPSQDASSVSIDPLNTICLFSSAPQNVDSISKLFPALTFRHILCRTPVLVCMSKKSSLANNTCITRDDILNTDIALCRNDGYFLRALYPSYNKSKIVIRSKSKSISYSILGGNHNIIAFTSGVEFYYFKDKPITCIPTCPKLETVYGYLSSGKDHSNYMLSKFTEMIEMEFNRIAKSISE